MPLFRLLLAAIFAAVLGYTLIVGAHHGYDLLPVFNGNIAAMDWQGQFNVDFTCFLLLSALWVAWRHQFRPLGLALAVPAFFGGSLFLSAYMLIASFAAQGDVLALLIGPHRASAR